MLKNKLLSAMGGAPANYIEDVFSTYLYTGTGNSVTQRIASGIDLATKGGMVWVKNRTEATDHQIYDTARGQRKYIRSNTTDAEFDSGANQVQYKTSGWDAFEYTNELNKVMASWTFRKQPKFFDVVTYTGTGTTNSVAHSLASVPGAIFIKRTSSVADWRCLCKNGTDYSPLKLNTTGGDGGTPVAINLCATSTTLDIGYIGLATGNTSVNTNGETYVAYIFAHNAGGFGLTGTDNVISCGSFTTDGSGNATIDLGYEPQWVLIKATQVASNWILIDNMRGWTTDGSDKYLMPDAANAELSYDFGSITSTGFTNKDTVGLNKTGIYIAIRRGPMKVPTSGTSVFSPVLANGGDTTITTNFPVDLLVNKPPSSTNAPYFMDRLRGGTTNTYNILQSSSTAAELVGSGLGLGFQSNVGIQSSASFYTSGTSVLWLNFRRAPSFFDEVCYTGTGASSQTKTHNLGVTPELMIIKNRGPSGYTQQWTVYPGPLGTDKYMFLNTTAAAGTFGAYWGDTPPTSTGFTVGNYQDTNASTLTYVAYLFATCAGVSKVGSYTGTGATQTISCGFTGGARFVLIKRTDSTGDWYVWDTARGMVSGTDPSLLLNTTAAEVNANSIYTTTGGFQIVSTAAGINASGGTYIYLAIA